MSVRIRLKRLGATKRPFYRVVVADQRSPRDGRFIENIGKYHPLEDPSLMEVDEERALHWLRVGAQPSQAVHVILTKLGIWERFQAERGGGDAPKVAAGAASGARATTAGGGEEGPAAP
jgi:small subunit ribosomal protein S16